MVKPSRTSRQIASLEWFWTGWFRFRMKGCTQTCNQQKKPGGMNVHFWSLHWSLLQKCMSFDVLWWRPWLSVGQSHAPSNSARVVGINRPPRDPTILSKHNSNLNMSLTKSSALMFWHLSPGGPRIWDDFRELLRMASRYSLAVKPSNDILVETLSLNLSWLSQIKWPMTWWQNQCKSTTMKSRSLKKMMSPESCRHAATALRLSSTSSHSRAKSSRNTIKSGNCVYWRRSEKMCQLINGLSGCCNLQSTKTSLMALHTS